MSVGYGRDTWCLSSLQPGRMVSGRTLLAQALFRRWTTPRGTLRGGAEEELYGIDLVGLVGKAATPTVLGAIPSMMRAEALKDDRVASISVSITSETDSAGLVHLYPAATVTPADGTENFTLTLDVTSASVQILGGLPT